MFNKEYFSPSLNNGHLKVEGDVTTTSDIIQKISSNKDSKFAETSAEVYAHYKNKNDHYKSSK